MYEFKFDGFTKEQCDKYLERIHASWDGNATLDNLNMLIHQHQINVPFENMALCMNFGTVDLSSDALFDKIVTNNRGGFCFELNGAFLLLLKGLGYDAVGCMARVGIPVIPDLLRLDHRGIIVRMEGKNFYVDVGMGGPKADWAVDFDGGRQEKNGHAFWIEDTYEGWKMQCCEGFSNEESAVIIFAPIAMLPMDFEANCENLVARGDTMFHLERLVNRNTEDGYIDIRNNTLKICQNGKASVREFEESEFAEILSKYFGIKYCDR